MDAPVDPVSPSLADFEYSMLTSRLQNLEQAQDPNHSLYQYSNQQIVKEIIKRHNQQNEMVRLSNIAQLEAQNRAAEAQFAGMPPLPPRLPPGPSSAWNTNIKQVAQFYQNCASGDLVSVKDFVETSSCDADTLDRGAESAAERNQVEVARFLFSKGVKLNSRIVSAALGRPDLKFFKLLVEEVGWHPNQALTNTGVALPSVVRVEPVLRYLLQAGADPNLGEYVVPRQGAPTDRKSGQALYVAAAHAEPHIVDLLISHGAKLEHAVPLHAAACAHSVRGHDRREMMRHLVHNLGVDINGDESCYCWSPYRQFGSPLNTCLEWGRVGGVEALLELGADPEQVEQQHKGKFDSFVAKVKESKGEQKFWADIEEMSAKGKKQKKEYCP